MGNRMDQDKIKPCERSPPIGGDLEGQRFTSDVDCITQSARALAHMHAYM